MKQALESLGTYYAGKGGVTAFSGFNPSGQFFQVFESENDGAGFAVNRYQGYDEGDEDGVDEIDGGQVTDLRYDEEEGELDESGPKPSADDIRKQAEFVLELAGF